MYAIPAALRSMSAPQCADGRWRGRLRLSSREDPSETFEATSEMLGYFERFSVSGALATDIDHVGNSRLELISSSGPGSLDVGIRAQHVHPGSWRVLLQMFAHCHAMEPFDSIVLLDERDSVTEINFQRPPPSMVLLEPYPGLLDASMLSEKLLAEDLEESFSLTVACSHKLENVEMQAVSSLVEDWGSLVYVGGYTSVDTSIDSPLLDKPDVVRQGRSDFEVSIRNWNPNLAALSGLINLLTALRRRLSIDVIIISQGNCG